MTLAVIHSAAVQSFSGVSSPPPEPGLLPLQTMDDPSKRLSAEIYEVLEFIDSRWIALIGVCTSLMNCGFLDPITGVHSLPPFTRSPSFACDFRLR